jgi:hypothetical protein
MTAAGGVETIDSEVRSDVVSVDRAPQPRVADDPLGVHERCM